MRLFRLFVATLWLVGLGLSAVPAHAAGTLTISPPIWSGRADGRLINKFNRQDCVDDAVAKFSIALRGAPTNALFQVWSGTGCDTYANRSSTAVSQTCTALTDALTPIDRTVEIHLRDMVAKYGATVDQSVGECDASTTAGLQSRSLYFVVSDPSSNATVVNGTPWAFTYDVKAPPPPAKVNADAGDGSLITRFVAPEGETNLLHYKFYCSPKGEPPTSAAASGGTSGTAGAADAAAAGADATETGGAASASSADTTPRTTTDSTCTSAVLVPGMDPPSGPPNGWIDCGEIAAQGANGGETKPVLTNDIEYVVAVATEDNVNNIGVLSNLACGVPKDTTGFFEAYNEAGGQAGGGFCSFAPAQRGGWATLIGFAIGAAAFLRRRK